MPSTSFSLRLAQRDREVIEALRDQHTSAATRPSSAAIIRLAVRRLARVHGLSADS